VTGAAGPLSGRAAADIAAGRAWGKGRLRLALILTLAVLVVEVAGGLLSGSLALLADAAHMFTDVAALTLAWAGLALGERAPTRRHTFGFGRAEVLAAFVNAQILLLASLGILWEAWRRFRSPGPIHTDLMLGVAAIGLAANLAAARLLHAGRRGSLGVRAAYLEVLADALASVAVIVAAIVMARTGWYGFDAALSAAIALVILPRGFGILREAAHILLEGAPEDIDIPRLRTAILGIPGVEAIHDVHFWTLTSGQHSASVHIRAAATSSRGEVLKGVQRVLRDDAGVDHATIQIEHGDESICHIEPEHA
jgi:cobalt-zinc-cadmium efflux system protein